MLNVGIPWVITHDGNPSVKLQSIGRQIDRRVFEWLYILEEYRQGVSGRFRRWGPTETWMLNDFETCFCSIWVSRLW